MNNQQTETKAPNPLPDIVELPIRGGVVLLNRSDLALVAGYSWSAHYNGFSLYAHSSKSEDGKRRTVAMHRILMQPGPGLVVDHMDGNGLNNARANLRVVTRLENSRNRKKHRPGFKGVSYHAPGNKSPRWRARITVREHGLASRTIVLGYFRTDEDAARAYDAAALKHHGDSAVLNFPESGGIRRAPGVILGRPDLSAEERIALRANGVAL